MAIINSGKINIVIDMPNKKLEKKVEKVVTELVRPLPFECKIYDKEPVEVTNQFSGKSCMLEPDAVAVFDSIKGAEITKEYDMAQKGLEWFRKYFPKEYMILLD